MFWLKLSLFFGRCCCCDLRVIQLNLYRASNRLLGFAPSDVTLWTFAALSGPHRRFSAETFHSPALENRDDERRTCRMPLYHHHQIVSFGLLASITARSRKKIRKMGGGPRNYYSLICFRARSPDLNFGPSSSSTRRRSHGFSRKLLMHRQQLRLNFRETTCQLWLLILHADPWLSDFPCSSWFWIIFPWNLRRSTVSQIGARRSMFRRRNFWPNAFRQTLDCLLRKK